MNCVYDTTNFKTSLLHRFLNLVKNIVFAMQCCTKICVYIIPAKTQFYFSYELFGWIYKIYNSVKYFTYNRRTYLKIYFDSVNWMMKLKKDNHNGIKLIDFSVWSMWSFWYKASVVGIQSFSSNGANMLMAIAFYLYAWENLKQKMEKITSNDFLFLKSHALSNDQFMLLCSCIY